MFILIIDSINDIDEHIQIHNTSTVTQDKDCQLNNDFYTSSICEGPQTDRGINLINNLPKPFVKQATNIPTKSTTNFYGSGSKGRDQDINIKNINMNYSAKNFSHKNLLSNTEIENRLKIENILIQFLLSARNGDKKNFVKHLN